MSKVKIQGNASGTGVLTVTAPNTSTDRTITLPDATATIATTTDVDARLPSITDGGNATAITIDSSENVGIKQTSPSSFSTLGNDNGHLVIGDGAGTSGVTLYSGSGGNYGHIAFADATTGTASYDGLIQYHHGDASMRLYTNGGNNLQIDSSGRVTMPNQPSFAASLSAGSTTGNASTIVFNVVRHNHGNHYNSSTGVFTAPVSGVYAFLISVMSVDIIQQNGTYNIRVNNSIIQESYSNSSTAHHHKWNWNGLVKLSASDTFHINTGALKLYGGSGNYSWFSGHLIA
jgi:hypothetical protein